MENEYKKELAYVNKYWEDNKQLYYAALYSPFCISVCSGTLAVGDYQHYMAEEAFILNAIAKGLDFCIFLLLIFYFLTYLKIIFLYISLLFV